ncbi:MAG: hypothetical protein ACXWZR_16695 [Mycobacterium sp.]
MTTDPDRRDVADDANESNDMRAADVANGENPDDPTSQAQSNHPDRGTAPGDADRVAAEGLSHGGGHPQETRDLDGGLPA